MTTKEKVSVAAEHAKIYTKNNYKKALTWTGVAITSIYAAPYVLAGTGLAVGFWLGRKAIGTIEK